MKIISNSFSVSSITSKKHLWILLQFFLIIFVYHTLKDLKDSIVITASDAGAHVIPFIKIWGMLPLAIGASYLFSKLYSRFGREKTLYIFVGLLLTSYVFFAFVLYPLRNEFYLNNLSEYLKITLPEGFKGFIAMICFWHYTLFYLAAELWSLLILAVLFWGNVNETTSLDEAKGFYPMCMFTGNFAGILSGQISHYFCYDLRGVFTWEQTLQLMIFFVGVCSIMIMLINRLLFSYKIENIKSQENKSLPRGSFKDNLLTVFQSKPLCCIAILVVGFGLTSNLIEVVWKESIRHVYPSPQAYNAYINQLTSFIGLMAVIMALISRWLFKFVCWSKVVLITPLVLSVTISAFFAAHLINPVHVSQISFFFKVSPIYFVMTLGSIHYVSAMTAKYTIFDTSKEMAFLSINSEDRIRAKSVIDSIGSRLGKSGASTLYQILLIGFGTGLAHISFIALTSLVAIGISIIASQKLGQLIIKKKEVEQENLEVTSSM